MPFWPGSSLKKRNNWFGLWHYQGRRWSCDFSWWWRCYLPCKHFFAYSRKSIDKNRKLSCGDFWWVVWKDQGTPLGRLYSEKRKVLGNQGLQCQIQIIQSFRYTVHYEKGDGQKSAGNIWNKLVWRRWREFSYPCFYLQRWSDSFVGYDRWFVT